MLTRKRWASMRRRWESRAAAPPLWAPALAPPSATAPTISAEDRGRGAPAHWAGVSMRGPGPRRGLGWVRISKRVQARHQADRGRNRAGLRHRLATASRRTGSAIPPAVHPVDGPSRIDLRNRASCRLRLIAFRPGCWIRIVRGWIRTTALLRSWITTTARLESWTTATVRTDVVAN